MTAVPEMTRGGETRHARWGQVIGVIALTVAAIGFVVGLQQGKTIPQFAPPPRDIAERDYADAIPATSYADFDRRLLGPNRNWTNNVGDLVEPPEQLAEPLAALLITDADRADFRLVRAARRAFDGAPPVVPHPIDQMSTAACAACHLPGLYVGKGVRASPMSHGFLPNCTQCHVEQHAAEMEQQWIADNSFVGTVSAGRGSRAWPGAPPTIPHTTWMRENCASCHGPHGSEPIRTSHPWQVSCQQCHVPSAVLDQVTLRELFR